jgi:integrase
MLPSIRLHDLRHTHATLALQAGVHPKVVSERLGHATVSITLDTYSHAIPAMQEEAAALIAGLVFAGCPEATPQRSRSPRRRSPNQRRKALL